MSLRFADRALQLTIADYLHSHDVLIARRDRVEAELATIAAESRCAATVARLRCLRGIDTLSALGLCAEIGEWERFDHPDQLAAYVGIVASEHTSGERRRKGSITKAGSTHARRLLIGASYHYRRQPGVGLKLERRQRDQPPEIINIAWRAQRRLNARWRQLKDARHKPNGVVAVAIARKNSPATAGRSPPAPLIQSAFRRHPCQRATPSRTPPPSRTIPSQPPPERRKLIALGIPAAEAHKCAWSRRGSWRNSSSRILHQALPTAYWTDQGLQGFAVPYRRFRDAKRTARCRPARRVVSPG